MGVSSVGERNVGKIHGIGVNLAKDVRRRDAKSDIEGENSKFAWSC